jgi:MinD-like ATPase involved in chromosome partitioning or flagellar assembly
MLPVGGGKGGVGKSFVVANLAVVLARSGCRVIAVDGDLEGANLEPPHLPRSPRTTQQPCRLRRPPPG